ncbi:MAG: MFS transporter [Chthoniobacteraceae bacterium]|nr:MFS transporter [Chthoniobacteraceae bacterium]
MTISAHRHHETKPEDRIPLREKVGFTLGSLGSGGATHITFGLIHPIFNMILGVSPALISTALFIQSIGTAVLDPLLGQFSDNFRSKWGRRKPLMAIFALPLAILSTGLYWFPRGFGEHQLFLWLLAILPLMTICCTCYGLPAGALSVESTTDYHERVRLGVFVGFFSSAVSVGYQWVFPLIQQPLFDNPLDGLRWVTGILGFLCAGMLLAPVFLCPEKRYKTQTGVQAKSPLLRNLAEASKNKQFLVIVSIKFFTFFCYTTVGALGMYMNSYFIYGGDLKTAAVTYGFLGSSFVISGVASLFVYRYLARQFGKKATLRFAAVLLMAGCVCKLFVYDPRHPWLQLIVLIANGASVQGLHLMTGTMFGDIIDYDELLFGKRREALYGSLFGLSEKLGGTVGGLVSGFLLVWIGFNAAAGAQTQHTLHLMQLFYFAFPFVGAAFAFGVISFYKITEERAYEIKEELKRRNAAKSAAVA